MKTTEVLETGADGRAERVAFAIDAGRVRDNYELAYVWSGDQQVEWDLVSGQMIRRSTARYTLDPSSEGTEVTYSLSVDLVDPDARACSSARPSAWSWTPR